MSGWFTTGTFWAGAIWGFSVGALSLYYWLARPMVRLLGFERDREADSQAEPEEYRPVEGSDADGAPA